MTITDLVAPEAILPALKVNSKKQALQELAARAAVLTAQNERAIFEVLLQREKLGTTAVGYGVAIPHGKLPKLEKLFGLFARLDRPIDFEAMEGQPVDLVFLLLAPEGAAPAPLKAPAPAGRGGHLFGAGLAAGKRGLGRMPNDGRHGQRTRQVSDRLAAIIDACRTDLHKSSRCVESVRR